MKKQRYLYIPIEIKKRELQAKAILAYYAALEGYQVILGQSTVIEKICKYCPAGIFLGTSIVKQHRKLFYKLKKYKYKVIGVDEEGLVYYNKENFIKHRINIDTLQIIDSFFSWGDHHYNLIESKQNFNNIFKVGNIRFELLKKKYHQLYSKDVESIKNKYGKYILINTNFGAYNNFKSSNDYTRSLSNLVDLNKKDLNFYKDKIEHQRVTFESFLDLANELSRLFPEHKIIIRPHPSEKIETYKNYEKNNLMVIFEGEVIPWILGSSCVLQQNCTTAIEALCLGKPIFSYLPSYDERFDGGLPNKVVPCFTDKKSLIVNIKKIIEDTNQWNEVYSHFSHSNLHDYISNMHDEENVFDAYLKFFNKLSFDNYKKLSILKIRILYNIEIAILNLLNKERRSNSKYISQKFNSLTKQELQNIYKFISKIENKNFDSICIQELTRNTFFISKIERNE